MRKFAIVSTQRTGSTLLIKLLDSHPHVLCAGEIFHPPSGSEHALTRYINQSAGRKFRHQLFRGRLVKDFLDEFYLQEGYAAIGFKYMYSQARYIPRSYPMVMRYLEDQQIHIIHGIRKNKLRVVLSRLISKSSGVYRSTSGYTPKSIHVPVGNLIEELKCLRDEDEKWGGRLSSLPYMKIDYESLIANKEAEERRLLSFVGVDYLGDLSSPFRKQGSDSLRAVIHNYDDVRRTLEDTEFAWCLDEKEGVS